ncbi:putative Tfp pilus assembly protein [Salinisphaera sp. PC39]
MHPAATRIGVHRRPHTGSALIVTLVLLLVLTVVGIAGMSATVLQERMAGNVQDSAQVFEAVESALRLCGNRVMAGDSDAVGEADADEMTDFKMGDESESPDRAERVTPTPGSALTALGETGYQLRCLIEFTGPVDPARTGGSLRRPGAAGALVGYRVTAAGSRVPKGHSGTARPTVILQSDLVLWK